VDTALPTYRGTVLPPAGWRGEARATLRLAAPIVLTQLSWIAMLTTDAAMIGRLGAAPLAGATLVLMVYFALYVIGFGLVTATASLAAQAFGAKRPRILRRVVRQGLWVTILVTVPGCIVLGFTEEVLRALAQPADAVAHANAYAATLLWSLPPAIGLVVLRGFVSAINRPAAALWVMLAGVPLNGALDYALIFGHFGAPRMELYGAGLATTIVNAAMFLALLAIAVSRPPFRRYAILGRFWRPDWQVFARILRIGVPIAGVMLLEGGYFIAATFLMGWFGTGAIAAHMIALQIPHITFMVPMGIAQAATVRVGQAAGRGDPRGAYRAGWVAIAIAGAFMTVTSIVILAMPETLASIFLDRTRPDSAAALSLAVALLLYAALFQAFDGIQAVAAGALRGLNDTALPMAIAGVSFWVVGLAGSIGFAFWAAIGARGVWVGFVLGLAMVAALLTLRFASLARRRYLPAMLHEAT
jgi:MATE family multidrug resistance protein